MILHRFIAHFMKNPIVLIAKKVLGVMLVLIGLFALVTPLTPGSWLALIGLEMLGFGYIWKDVIKPIVIKFSNKTPGNHP